ncbi:glycosyltransferase family 4 protein [Spirosoma soli]|uniref:Glycosyltransferase family 4 protein n=1 Tax=Spirosoma soli TaxID=1770529 RepID=A0ABW5LXZ7_9BACT
MNVLIVTFLAATSPSGVVTYYKSLADDLAREGVGVHVVSATNTPYVWRKMLAVLKRILRSLGGAYHVFYDEFAYFTGLYLAVRNRRHESFDLIHAQDPRSGVAAYLALGKRVPIVLTCHFNDDPVTELATTYSLKGWFLKKLTAWYKYLFSYVRHYVFVSNYAYEKSRHLLPATISKQILYNTVNIKANRVTRRPSDPLLISNVGYIDERKNQKLLIQIGHELRKRGITNFAIWLIGDGPKRSEYEQLVESLGLGEQVKFYGRQAAPWQLVAQTDLYIHTALNDNCPYSIIEAFAVKTPVLALPVGGVPELLPQSHGPLQGTDVVGLASEVATYFDPAARTQLANAQSVFADLKLNHQKALADLISFYHQSASNS